ncbi:MAG: O-antigen polysaccharide polymerase Wzy [Clostridia bacterium]|nr:O-antigen polysaccharide polymerase Wzy [Clostridia bacterium]
MNRYIKKAFKLLILIFFLAVNIIAVTRTSPKSASILSAVTVFVCLFLTIKRKYGVTPTICLLIYTILTQFGLVWPYVVLGNGVLSNYNIYTLRFLKSIYLPQAICIASVAIICFSIGFIIADKETKNELEEHANHILSDDGLSQTGIVVSCAIILSITLLVFIFGILRGDISIFGSYSDYMSSELYSNSFYVYLLLFYGIGTVFLFTINDKKIRNILFIIWFLIAAILFLTGNKGEVLYAAFTCYGFIAIEKKKANRKLIVLGLIMLFLIIPLITNSRPDGVVANLNNIKFSFTDAFVEMGMQIRMSVFMINDVKTGVRHLLLGKSYYNPVLMLINHFIPLFGHLEIATRDIYDIYKGYGSSQVAESYLNFGLYGVVGFFGILGFILRHFEQKIDTTFGLALFGCVVFVFMNATRNHFYFVPVQLVIVFSLFLVLYIIPKRKHLQK